MVDFSQKKYLLFDLDGTLTDPAEGITGAVRYALRQFDIHVEDRKVLLPFIGPPLKESFEKYYGFSSEQADEAVRQYRVYFSDRGIFENEVYDGIPAMLQGLCDAGRVLVLATSKPHAFAERILEHFDLKKYFTAVVGSEFDGTRVKKSEVVEYALQQIGSPDKSSAVMIGDREHDVFGAKANGLHSIGVLFGYGSREELQNAGADAVVGSVRQLTDLLG